MGKVFVLETQSVLAGLSGQLGQEQLLDVLLVLQVSEGGGLELSKL